MEIHEAANSFPMMDAQRYSELLEDIKINGQLEPITVYDGMILDGRNRYKACLEFGIEPKTRQWKGDDPWMYVWSLNGQRRDIIAEQRYLIWKHCHENSGTFQAEKKRIQDEANRKRSEAMQGVAYAPKGGQRKPEKVIQQSVVEPLHRKGQISKAKAAQVNPGAVARGDKIAKDRPDLAEKIRTGELKPAEAHRQMKKDSVKEKVSALPEGKYRIIYADPPWQYNDSRALSGYENTAAEGHYPTMPTQEICALPIQKLSQDDAVLFCWATFPLLPDALEVVRAWGFKYKTAFVWSKKRPNMGHYHRADAELLLIATRGSCTPDSNTRHQQVQEIERRGKHSSKPEEFTKIIDEMYPHGGRIELFRRGEAPDGWSIWGNESK